MIETEREEIGQDAGQRNRWEIISEGKERTKAGVDRKRHRENKCVNGSSRVGWDYISQPENRRY